MAAGCSVDTVWEVETRHSFPRPERWPGIEEEEHGHHLALVSCSCLPPIIIGAVNRVASVGS